MNADIVIPHQDCVSLTVVEKEGRIDITQEDITSRQGEQCISVYGRTNIDLLISALQKAREVIG